MNRLLAIVLAASLALMAVVSGATASPKNVVLIVADDMGFADTGITGVEDYVTPNIDAIARAGAIFNQAYVTAAVCSPSRAGFLTGRYQQRFGHEHNGGGPPPFGLPLAQKTMGDHFKAAGYATGAIGKWHLGETPEYHPMSRGFDEFVGHLGGGHAYFPASDKGPGLPLEKKILDGREPAEWNEYLTTYFGHRAVSFIDRHADGPFFLYLAFNAPHTPQQAREEDLARFADIKDPRRQKYAAMVYAMDESIGEVLAEIKAKGIEDDTVVVFMSDNGGPQPGDPSVNGSKNNPFRGGKSQYFEGGIRVPMFIKMPGVISPETTYDHAVSSLDLLPTLLASVGKTPIDGVDLDGKNLIPYLTGEAAGPLHERLYWRLGGGMAYLKGDYKLVVGRRKFSLPGPGERPDMSKAQLFNVEKNKWEDNKGDLVSSEPDRFKEMVGEWGEWNQTLVTPLWGMRKSDGAAADSSDDE